MTFPYLQKKRGSYWMEQLSTSAEVRCFLGEFEVVVEMRLRLRLRTGAGVMFNLNFLFRKSKFCKKD